MLMFSARNTNVIYSGPVVDVVMRNLVRKKHRAWGIEHRVKRQRSEIRRQRSEVRRQRTGSGQQAENMLEV